MLEANRNKAYWENKMAEEAEIFKAAMLTIRLRQHRHRKLMIMQ